MEEAAAETAAADASRETPSAGISGDGAPATEAEVEPEPPLAPGMPDEPAPVTDFDQELPPGTI